MTNRQAYQLTPDAQTDLIEIRRYTLNQWGHEQSKAYLSELRQSINALSKTPGIGKQRLDVGTDIYSFPYASHVIYYTLCKQGLVIFAVLHKRMLPLSHLLERDTI